jgi:hypothetical protein
MGMIWNEEFGTLWIYKIPWQRGNETIFLVWAISIKKILPKNCAS